MEPRTRCAQNVDDNLRVSACNLQELLSTALMVESHTTGGMSDTALATWIRGTNHFTACAALCRTAGLLQHVETNSSVVLAKGEALVRAGDSLLEALRDSNHLTWNTYLRLSADVLEAHDHLLVEMQSVCYNHAVNAQCALHRRGRSETQSMDICRQTRIPPRRSQSGVI